MLALAKENAIFHFLIISISIYITIKLLDVAIDKEYKDQFLDRKEFQSSIWCSGTNHNDRKCRSRNMCYDRRQDLFVFVSGPSSILSGLPNNLYDPSLLTLSSVIDHNQFYFNYVSISYKYLPHFISHREVLWIENPTVLFGRFKPDNLMHSFHDDIIPLWWTLLELGLKKNFSIFTYDFWPEYDRIPFNHAIYRKLFAFDKVFHKSSLVPDSIMCFKDLRIGLSKETTWYQYGFRVPQGPLNATSFKQSNIFKAGEMLRLIFRSNQKCNGSHGLLLTRSNNRLLLNERDLIDQISQNLPSKAIAINYDSHSSNILQIINQILCANFLIAMHGSGIILSFFLSKGSHLIELFPYGIHPDHYTPYKTLANYRKINYQTWTNKNIKNTVTHPEYPQHLGGINHLPEEKKTKIQQLDEDLEPHLCCDDVNWLFRIHQDTFVDVNDFKKHVKFENTTATITQNKEIIEELEDVNFYPGPVENLACSYHLPNNSYKIVWHNPWNLQFNPLTEEPTFQILVDNHSGSLAPIQTAENHIIIPFSGQTELFIWIRCQVNQKKGPFRYVGCKGNYSA